MSDWTVILVDKPNKLFLNESSTDVNNLKWYGALSDNHLFVGYLCHVTVGETDRGAAMASTPKVHKE